MKVRKGIIGSTVAAGLLLLAGSVAWACVSASGPYLGSVTPKEAPVQAVTQVSGGGWAADQAVQVSLATSPSAQANPLAVVTPDSSGNVATSVQIPTVGPGTYYMVLSQGSSTPKALPFRVLGSSNAGAPNAVAASAPGTEGSGQDWNGLRADGTKVQGLVDLPKSTQSSSSMLPTMALALGASLVLGGLVAAEVRRRKVHSHAEVRDVV